LKSSRYARSARLRRHQCPSQSRAGHGFSQSHWAGVKPIGTYRHG
jgi:hypothetical protein